MGFRRKTAFYSRLAVLFRLHANDAESRTENDYRLVWKKNFKDIKMISQDGFWTPHFLNSFYISEFYGIPVVGDGVTASFKLGQQVGAIEKHVYSL